MWIENMVMALSAIRANKMRSFLTMLGIIIGIGSVISIVSIGDTMRGSFEDLYQDVGTTLAYASIGYWVEDFRQSDHFTLDEVERMKEVFKEDIAYADSDAYVSTEVNYGRDKMKFNFTGIDNGFMEVQPVQLLSGRYLNEGDILGRKKNVLMEAKSAVSLFGTENAVGKVFRTTIYGSTEDYTVIGVYRKEINPMQALFNGDDGGNGSAYIPYSLLTWPNDYFYGVRIYAKEGTDMKDFSTRLAAYLGKSKDRAAEDFRIYTAADDMASINSVMGGLSAAVGGIAAISLLVGGIGIMNIMLVSVTERTREIGIRKSLGAKTADILIQFLTESALLSACGGIVGVLMGTGLVAGGSRLFGLNAVIKLPVVLMAVGFSAAVGIFFGLYPASKAAKKDPIEALRYE